MSQLADIPLADLKRLHGELAEVITKREPLTKRALIEQLVEREFNLLQNSMHASTKKLAIARPRQIVMTLIHESGMSWHDAGNYFRLGYDTAIYGAKTIASLESTDPDFSATMQDLRIKCAKAIQTA